MAVLTNVATRKVWFGLSACLAFAELVFAQSVPQLVNYQGKLTDAEGTALPTGDYTITISIFREPAGGTAVWGPHMFDGQAGEGHGARVPIVQGFFNVVLGPKDTAGRDIIAAFATKDAYIEVTVEDGTPITPRQQILATPYVMNSDDGNPTGMVVAFAGESLPSGWFLCDGTPLSKYQYPHLWDAIGTSWGDGTKNPDGSDSTGTDFNLPNFQGRFLRGIDNRTTGGDDPDAPRPVGSLQGDDFKSHTHSFIKDPYCWDWSRRNLGSSDVWGHNPDPLTATENRGGPETRPKNAAVNFIIKY